MVVLEVPVGPRSTPNRLGIGFCPRTKFHPTLNFHANRQYWVSKKIFSNIFPVKKHISRPQKICALKSTWNPSKSQYPDLERKLPPCSNISRKSCKILTQCILHAMSVSYLDINLQRTCTCSHHYVPKYTLKVRVEINPHAANLHGSRNLLRTKCTTAYWWPTLGIALQRKRNLATAANKKNSP